MGRQPTAAVVAHGCPKNTVDSEHLLSALAVAGYRLVSRPSQADVAVVTTCAFIQAAVAESERTIRELLSCRRGRGKPKVVVAGCLVQRFGPGIRQRLPGVDVFAGLDELTRIPELLESGTRFLAANPPTLVERRPARIRSRPVHYAYLKVADGCDNRCSYCTIPAIRGSYRSRRLPDIVSEARSLVQSGARELILVAQDTTAYGSDIYRRPALVRLLRRLSAIRGLRWLRLMYAHPARVTEELIGEFRTNRKLCRYIDLPIQHISDRLLARMNRPYRRRAVEQLISRFRSVPEMRIRTTVIVGFPGETDREFCELLDFVADAHFDRLGAYTYSPEQNTEAALLRPQVPAAVRQSRLHALMRTQTAVSRRRLRSLLGRRLTVAMDTPGYGRTEWDAPEIDGKARLSNGQAVPGRFISARVVRTGTHDLSICRVRSGR